jgi:HEPN domain-containing protein
VWDGFIDCNDKSVHMDEVSQYWIDEAVDAIMVLDHLFEKGDYLYALFFGHLAIEKMLKGLYVANKGEHAPPIHNLPRLARLADIQVSQEKNEQLVLITGFNIEARYPDLNRSFRKKCTKDYAAAQIRVIRDIMKWLRETMNSKK